MKQRGQRLVGRLHFFLVYLIVIFVCILFIGSYVYASEKQKETISSSNELVFFSASELAEKIKSHQVTSLEVVNAYLNHIEKHNHTLNAIVTLDKDAAIRRAQEADAALARGELWGPLHGVPITIKDNLPPSGLRPQTAIHSLPVMSLILMQLLLRVCARPGLLSWERQTFLLSGWIIRPIVLSLGLRIIPGTYQEPRVEVPEVGLPQWLQDLPLWKSGMISADQSVFLPISAVYTA
jgi:low affinity Fe/Cu permease